MEPLTIRVPNDLRETLDREATEHDVSVSEYVRTLIERGREYDDLANRLAAREDRIEELEDQLRRRSQMEDKLDELADLPEKVSKAETYQERRQRLLDKASLTERLKWKVTGVPVEEIED